LTTDIGRMIDRLILYVTNDSVYALTGENHADAIARYLMRFVFFNDDFQLQDISSQTTIFALYGPEAGRILGEEASFPEVTMPLHHWRKANIGSLTAYLHRTDPINSSGYFVMCEASDKTNLKDILLKTDVITANEAAFDFLRIEAGQPRFGHEITTDYNPLEAGLWNDVSFSKGCYTGQEIIARMESRGQLAKRLVRLSSNRAISEGETINSSGKQVGSVTSAAATEEGTLALGYVKTSTLLENNPLFAGDQSLNILNDESEIQI
jgi:folate-binding protein YgfZ